MKSLIKLCLGAAVAVSLSTAAVAGPFNETDQCSSCAMVIKKYPGPKGLLVLKDKSVQKFCSARGTACGYAAAMKKTGVVHVFMHDAGAVDWKNPDALEDLYIKISLFHAGRQKSYIRTDYG